MAAIEDLFVRYRPIQFEEYNPKIISWFDNFKNDTESTPVIPEASQKRAKQVVQNITQKEVTKNTDQSSEQLPQFSDQSQQQQSQSQSATSSGPTVKLAGYDVPKSWLEMKWKQECGDKLGEMDERHRKGIVVKGNNGKADNKGGHKTYGPGLLYHPESGKWMQDVEPAGGFSKEELTRLFYVHIEKMLQKGREIGCKNWNQAAAYGGIRGNFGGDSSVTKTLTLMIQSGKSDQEIFNFIAHASDSQRKQFPGLITRRMWEARQWIGDFDPNGFRSEINLNKTKQLNPG